LSVYFRLGQVSSGEFILDQVSSVCPVTSVYIRLSVYVSLGNEMSDYYRLVLVR